MIEIQAFEVGKMYEVPTIIQADKKGRLDVWPVIGAAHEDKKIIGFPETHYHYDARFMTDRQIAIIETHRAPGEVAVFSTVAFFKADEPIQEVIYRWRKCRRAYVEYPDRKAIWLSKLEAEYEGSKLDQRLICPHRGASLQGLQVSDGCVTCPLHGLRFDCKTGELMKRAPVAKVADAIRPLNEIS